MAPRGRGCGRGRGRLGDANPEMAENNPLDFMAAAMQTTAKALGNQINNENNGNNDYEGPMMLASFLKVHPLTFRGTSNPTKADNWIQKMERTLQAQQVSEEQWVEFGTY
ncbi:hypothetical protein AHAS_Ahas15G0150800 [Arachis hypogaea]